MESKINYLRENYKSTKKLVQYLVKSAGYNANFLLNVGPMPNGKIQPEFVKTLGEMGEWMKKYGETIYGTRGGPVTPKSWGVTTAKGNLVYVHLLNPESETLLLPEFGKKVKKAYLFDDNSKVDFKQDGFGTVIKVPSARLHEIDTIVVIEI